MRSVILSMFEKVQKKQKNNNKKQKKKEQKNGKHLPLIKNVSSIHIYILTHFFVLVLCIMERWNKQNQ